MTVKTAFKGIGRSINKKISVKFLKRPCLQIASWDASKKKMKC